MTARSACAPYKPAAAAASYIDETKSACRSLSVAILGLVLTCATATAGDGFARGDVDYEDWKVALECRGKADGKTVMRGDLFYFVGKKEGFLAEKIVPISDGPAALVEACDFVRPSREVDEMRFWNDLYHDAGNFR